MRDQFTFYRSFYEAVKVLPPEDQVSVILAITSYALDDILPDLQGTAAAIFMLIRPVLDAGRRRAESGKAGGIARHRGGKTQAKHAQTTSEDEREFEDELEVKEDFFAQPTKSPSQDTKAALQKGGAPSGRHQQHLGQCAGLDGYARHGIDPPVDY